MKSDIEVLPIVTFAFLRLWVRDLQITFLINLPYGFLAYI